MQHSIPMNTFSTRAQVGPLSPANDAYSLRMEYSTDASHISPYPPYLAWRKSPWSALSVQIGWQSAQGWVRYFSILGSHATLSRIARTLPEFDGSRDFVDAPLMAAARVGQIAVPATVVGIWLSLVISFWIRYDECVAAGSVKPALDLRRKWTPSFWTADMHRAGARVWAVVACVVAAYIVNASGLNLRTLDALHAAVVGAVAHFMFVTVRDFFGIPDIVQKGEEPQ